ncbi:MAG: PQQ-dependent sugar dehydrogenase, partial [Bacteroidetes bacterium]|nr:PQQ-dependent sugar dehydrogenase [Fibrella sp.]
NGKILRVNDDGSVPSDNPFVASDTARREVWSYGHRNPQGLAFQARTGLLFDSEHGPSGGDEVNQIEKGKNYGWPRIHHRDTLTGMVAPLLEYTPSVGPAEAIFYEGDAFPALKGNLLVAALRGESIIRIQMNGNKIVAQERLLQKQYGRIRALAVGPDGYIYFSTSQQDPPEGTPRPGYDMILRLRPVPAGTSALTLGPLTADSRPMGETVALNNAPENIYQQLCASCHGEKLQGTDRAKGLYDHTYGATRSDIVRIIRQGIPDQGMPAWDGAIKPADMDRLADFILAKTSTKPPSIR